MSLNDTQPGTHRGTANSREADLERQLAAVQQQREFDQVRLSQITRERDLLKFELVQSAAASPKSGWITSPGQAAEMEQDEQERVDAWLLKPGAERARLRQEPAFGSSIITRLTASLVLRLARIAARNRHYATAEVLYQAILFLAPRAFIWRQAGNMLAGQGLFLAAIDCFNQAITIDEGDSEAWHARGVALRRLERNDESRESLARAFSLNPTLVDRKIS